MIDDWGVIDSNWVIEQSAMGICEKIYVDTVDVWVHAEEDNFFDTHFCMHYIVVSGV